MIRANFHNMVSKYKTLTRLQRLCCWILSFHLLLAVFANLIANDKPLLCKCHGTWSMPALGQGDRLDTINYNTQDCSVRIMPTIPWSSRSIDAKSSGYASPLHRSGEHIHWLGTDALGRDVLAGLIHGTRYAWIIGLMSTMFAAIPGIFLGMMIGYWKDDRLRWSWGQGIATCIWTALIFYELNVLWWNASPVLFLLIFMIAGFVWYITTKLIWKYTATIGKTTALPLDQIIMRGIDIFESFPKLLLLMALMVMVTRPSILSLSILIALIRWTLFTQMSRSETLKESVSNYVIAAENINIPWYRILIRHIWPNIKSTLLVTAIFTFSASILLEASLSFIGLGMRLEEVTWGSLMNEGRNYLPGWWLSLFPGLAIFSLLFALNWLFIKQKNFDSIEEKSTI